ncbi:TetR/AcrR family transcriptional regulator C-terminal domain-containing protein [Kibdelosporangium lantanae]
MAAAAPYLRIVAEIRGRIASGRLRPGDKVPSTRQITQEWGVAMATATKVISALRDLGLVDTRPGAGTVVRGQRTPAADPDLDRERIVRTALAIADTEGLAAASMRRLATELGVATMSLYRHVSSKDDLLLLMADMVAAGRPLPARLGPWRADMETVMRHFWTMCRDHQWMAEVMSMTRPRATPHMLAYTERALAVLRGVGMPPADVMHTFLNLFGHIRGLASALAEETRARQDTGMTSDEWMETTLAEVTELLASGRYPTMAYLITVDFEQDLDVMFEYGMRLMLDGVERRLTRPGRLDLGG